MQAIESYGYFLVGAGQALERRDFKISSLEAHEAIVEVAGCGLCHTDLGFYAGHVKTNHELPLVLGHEISGKVMMAGSDYETLIGKSVVIPAVLPCGACELCKSGRSNVCRAQKMPGNDFNGGFASHIKVPARFLCVLPENLGNFEISELSVIADAVTTPYQSLMRSNLKSGDLAIVVGVGGIGIYMAQLAKDAGATVIALDIDDSKLEKAKNAGARFTVNTKGLSDRDTKDSIRMLVKENNLPKLQWKVFECSGTASGQDAAFSLLTYAGTLGVVGFTMDKVSIRLSNMMAFDADLFGNWGCKPEYYPAVVDKVLQGRINIRDNIEKRPLVSINETILEALGHKLLRRVVLTP